MVEFQVAGLGSKARHTYRGIPKHYERAEGFAIGYAKGHEKGFEIGYDKGIVAATARVEVRNTLNAKLRALAKEYGIPEDKLPLADEDDD